MLEVQVGTVADSESRALLKPVAVVAATRAIRSSDGGPAPDLDAKVHSARKQGTRLIKLTAACCGCTVRTTANGSTRATRCAPHGQPMAEE
jgi:hypothetical protein